MTDTADLPGVPYPRYLMATVTVGTGWYGSVALFSQGMEKTLDESGLFLLMTRAAVRQDQSFLVWPVIHTFQLGVAIDAGEILVGTAHQVLTDDIQGKGDAVSDHLEIGIVVTHLAGLVVLTLKQHHGKAGQQQCKNDGAESYVSR